MSPEARRPTTVTSSQRLSTEDPVQPSKAKAACQVPLIHSGISWTQKTALHIRLLEPVWAGHSSGLPHGQVSL